MQTQMLSGEKEGSGLQNMHEDVAHLCYLATQNQVVVTIMHSFVHLHALKSLVGAFNNWSQTLYNLLLVASLRGKKSKNKHGNNKSQFSEFANDL